MNNKILDFEAEVRDRSSRSAQVGEEAEAAEEVMERYLKEYKKKNEELVQQMKEMEKFMGAEYELMLQTLEGEAERSEKRRKEHEAVIGQAMKKQMAEYLAEMERLRDVRSLIKQQDQRLQEELDQQEDYMESTTLRTAAPRLN